MPYKDPERKRQWERQHREERNARRRNSFNPRVVQRLNTTQAQVPPARPAPAPRTTAEIVAAPHSRAPKPPDLTDQGPKGASEVVIEGDGWILAVMTILVLVMLAWAVPGRPIPKN